MIVDIRRLGIGSGSARPVYQHGHFCVRSFHRLISYPCSSLFILLLLYLLIMEFMLYFQIRIRGSIYSNSLNRTYIQNSSHSIHIFNPLPIKKILVTPVVHYARSPLAESVQVKLHFTHYFPFISANAISYFHCLLALISIKFISSESLFRRQIGVVIFQLRTFLDCLDGVIYRAHATDRRYKSHYGDFGYYVDAVSDIFGGACLIIGCLLYFNKQRPFCSQSISRRSSTPHSNISTSSSASDTGNDESDTMILNIDEYQSYFHDSISLKTTNDLNSNLLANKRTIFMTLLIFSFRYSMSAFFWDRNVRLYEELLDSKKNTLQEKSLQLNILHSPLTILIFYFWRYISALSLQDYLQFAIFIDRPWDFLQKTNKFGWCILLWIECLTELHIHQIESVFDTLGFS